MTVTAVVGAQWGDEGKGRIVDYLASAADLVVRYQGGDNAGHTVINDQGIFKLHLVPSGIFNPATLCLLGTGMVVNPGALLAEIEGLEAAGVSTANLWISNRAHMVMPYHPLLDGLEEAARGAAQIGTTGKGIGPAYADKAARNGVRIGDLLYPAHLRARLELVLPRVNRQLTMYDQPALSMDDLMNTCAQWALALRAQIVDPLPMLREAVTAGRRVLLEGQLGVIRDLDWGIYPYVTSSNPIAAGAYAGAGLPVNAISEVIGVVKAYSTCVGKGPFPVELMDETGDRLRSLGTEYGATTGRPRRCGWLDGVALGHYAWLSGFTQIAITKLDVLDTFSELKICVAYMIRGERITELPDTPLLEEANPVYETWPGWQADTTGARSWEELPPNAQAYVKRIAELAHAPVTLVSVGAERDALLSLPR